MALLADVRSAEGTTAGVRSVSGSERPDSEPLHLRVDRMRYTGNAKTVTCITSKSVEGSAMSTVSIRPDMRTPGGEVSDIVLNGRYAGEITLVYREGSRLSGAVQLEKTVLTPSDKRKVLSHVQEYINSLAAAIDAADCEVIVTCSAFDQVIAMEHNIGEIESFIDEPEAEDDWDDYEADYVDDDASLSDYDPDQSGDSLEMVGTASGRSAARKGAGQDSRTRTGAGEGGDRSGQQDDEEDLQAAEASDLTAGSRSGRDRNEPYELVITGEHGNSVEYHIYARDRHWLAEAFVTMYGSDCIGEINWMVEPTPGQIERSVELLVSDFDEDHVDTFKLDVKHNGELLEVYELEHEDLMNRMDAGHSGQDDDEFSVHLVRNDGDTLTYDIYSSRNGPLPIGTATIDISQRKLTGYMDFREMNSERDHEQIASLLMRELDKEKDYESFNLTVLYKNRPIDELLFENAPVQ